MTTKSSKKKTTKKNNVPDNKKKREIQSLIIIALGIFLVIAMFFDITGMAGTVIRECLKGCFGLAAYILPFYLLLYGVLMLIGRTKILRPLAITFFILLFLDVALLNATRFIDAAAIANPVDAFKNAYKTGIELESGGVCGMFLAVYAVKLIGKAGAIIAGILLALVSVIIITDKPYAQMADWESKASERAKKREEKKKKELEKAKEKEREIENKKEQALVENTNKTEQYEEPKYVLPDYSKTRKALKKAKLAENQKHILSYMTDENLQIGKGMPSGTNSFGLDGSEEGFTQTVKEPVKETPSFIDDVDISNKKDVNAETSLADKFTGFVLETEDYEESSNDDPSRISNKEAKEAELKSDDFNEVKSGVAYKFPPISLLKKASSRKTDFGSIEQKKRMLESTLESFNVDAKVTNAVSGPTVTRYEIQPGPGVKVSKVVNLQDDIALNLRAKSIRIEAPIPGKAAIGIEVENENVNMVSIREIIDSNEFREAKSKISFSVGKDISGNVIIGDLKSMPHLLIAGSTGSGKSVCINSIISSIIYKAKPDEVKLVLIDPKVVELGNYNGIPHLLIPVVTEPSKAAAALNWAVAEMNNRYKKFAESGVRDLESYNEHVMLNEEDEEFLPQIVVIIDELADLMMAAPSQVEESICRLAQMARAAGMHLIVATQRPSVDVITGVIKANIPSRIAFAVSSQFDSRTILDMSGAEKLVGKGDMLYSPIGIGKPIRVQGCFISDSEVNSVIDFVKKQALTVKYEDDIIQKLDKPDLSDKKADDEDELLSDCIDFIVSAGQASVSMLQRRFRIGYNRAARIMDIMEERNIVGPPDGSRPRQVLLTPDDIDTPESSEYEDEQ